MTCGSTRCFSSFLVSTIPSCPSVSLVSSANLPVFAKIWDGKVVFAYLNQHSNLICLLLLGTSFGMPLKAALNWCFPARDTRCRRRLSWRSASLCIQLPPFLIDSALFSRKIICECFWNYSFCPFQFDLRESVWLWFALFFARLKLDQQACRCLARRNWSKWSHCCSLVLFQS